MYGMCWKKCDVRLDVVGEFDDLQLQSFLGGEVVLDVAEDIRVGHGGCADLERRVRARRSFFLVLRASCERENGRENKKRCRDDLGDESGVQRSLLEKRP